MTVEKEPTERARLIRDRRYAARARDGFRHLLSSCWTGGDARVVLPAYIGQSPREGSGILDPLRELGIPFSFYSVDRELRVDLSSLREELGRGPVYAALLIHYFGGPQRATKDVRAACADAGAVLIEDCCHSLDPGATGVGDVGDYALFSIHKVLPCDDGGILQVNAGAEDPGPIDESVRAPELPVRLWRDARFDRIADQRSRNYRSLSRMIDGIRGVRPFWPKLPEGTVPLNFPVLIEEVDRFDVYQRMRADGIGVVALYHTLVAEIDAAAFPVSSRLSRTMLNLPIHQDIDEGGLRATADALRRAVASAATVQREHGP